jgi:hypothetical protein
VRKNKIENYGNFKKWTNEWVKLAIEHSKLGMALEKKLDKSNLELGTLEVKS